MKIQLRKIRLEDAESFRDMVNNPDVIKELVGIPYPCSLDDAKNYIKDSLDKNKRKETYEFSIISNKEFVGAVVLEHPNKLKTMYEVGFVIAKKHWNKGIATDAVKKIVNFGFNTLNISKIKGDNDDDNPASGKVFEKNGFKIINKVKKGSINVIYWEKTKK